MARCPDCNKFVALEQEEPEVEAEVSEERETGKAESSVIVSGNVQLGLSCADCGTGLKGTDLDFEAEEVEFLHKTADCTGELEVYAEGESSDRYEGIGRYAKHFYGADIRAKVSCVACEAKVEVTASVEEQASAFEDC